MKVEGLGKIGAWARCNHLNKLGVANDCAGPLEKRHEVPGFRRNDKKWCFSTFCEAIKVANRQKLLIFSGHPGGTRRDVLF